MYNFVIRNINIRKMHASAQNTANSGYKHNYMR